MTKRRTKIRTFEGLPVIDADNSIRLHIIPNDVKNSRKKDPAMCAAAKAGQRELGTDVRVFLTRTYVKKKNHWVRFITPESVSREIISFDRGATFEPGEYNFRPAPPQAKLGVYRGTRSDNKTNRKVRKYHTTGNIREKGKYDKTTANLVKKEKK